MTESQLPIRGDDDAEGHGYKWADAETPEGQDAEGHAFQRADAETSEGDDTEGHGRSTP